MADIIFVAIIALFACVGAKRGLIRTLTGLVTTAASILLSIVLYPPVSQILSESSIGDTVRANIEKLVIEKTGTAAMMLPESAIAASSQMVINAISFAIIVVLAKIVISVIVNVINIASKLPLIRQANSLLGLTVGAISGALICYIAIGIIGAFETEEGIVAAAQAIKDSLIASSFYHSNVITEFLR